MSTDVIHALQTRSGQRQGWPLLRTMKFRSRVKPGHNRGLSVPQTRNDVATSPFRRCLDLVVEIAFNFRGQRSGRGCAGSRDDGGRKTLYGGEGGTQTRVRPCRRVRGERILISRWLMRIRIGLRADRFLISVKDSGGRALPPPPDTPETLKRQQTTCASKKFFDWMKHFFF